MNFYNEIDPHAAEWIRGLIRGGLIPDGIVDERSIVDIRASELTGYRQCHFFAGVAGWSLAGRLAGIPDDAEWDSGSAPCQPFSDAGDGLGEADERHLWPAFFNIIRERRSRRVVGEQVASKMALGWLDGVFSDLESADYACWAQDLCSAGVNSPNLRQRLYWMGHSTSDRPEVRDDVHAGLRGQGSGEGRIAGFVADAGSERPAGIDPLLRQDAPGRDEGEAAEVAGSSPAGRLGDTSGSGGRRNTGTVPCAESEGPRQRELAGCVADQSLDAGSVERLADSDGRQPGNGGLQPSGQHGQQPQDGIAGRRLEHPEGHGRDERRTESGWRGVECGCPVGVALGDTNDPRSQGRGLRPVGDSRSRSPWASGSVFIPCSDGKQRRVGPGVFPLVTGIPSRVGPLLTALRGLGKDTIKNARANRTIRLRGYGNAINPYVAAEFLGTLRDAGIF